MLTADVVLHSFSNVGELGTDGEGPAAGLTLVGSTVYGTTSQGGTDGGADGTIFSYNPSTNDYQVLYSFQGGASDGSNPDAGLTLVGTTLYGTTSSGGSAGDGTIFSFNLNTNVEKVLYSFQGGSSDGAEPLAGLTLVGSTLYGTTSSGGSVGGVDVVGGGTIFSYNTNTNAYQVLYSFQGGNIVNNAFSLDGSDPDAGLTLVGATLYGTTSTGGSNEDGTIFAYTLNTNNYQSVYSFQGNPYALQSTAAPGAYIDGAAPEGGLTFVGSTLYGTTSSGGVDENGTIFSYNPNTNDEQVLYSFQGGTSDGAEPLAGLTLDGSTLYGTTAELNGTGGSSSSVAGTIFSYDTNTNNYQNVYLFQGGTSDGAESRGGGDARRLDLVWNDVQRRQRRRRHHFLDSCNRQRGSRSTDRADGNGRHDDGKRADHFGAGDYTRSERQRGSLLPNHGHYWWNALPEQRHDADHQRQLHHAGPGRSWIEIHADDRVAGRKRLPHPGIDD